ncbi:HAD family hydrolase [Paenarthrobacter sp. Z7-10]|uniref:HAD family hydrolase n=1 Tax=Paenarthrobacter sp. Z7-10 TaxID=2787635 RepID=UPI0022A8DD56|nr:HAD family hydrolase [Paenarthrobacter sp. Z7-10]MCZ2401900.1 HAD family hydrolase [Paenarthrobacter sp. Z7-10]
MTAGHVVVACDLDRTLIYSPKAFWLQTPDELAPSLVVVELYQGLPISFMTLTAQQLLRSLATEATFVPVTTRTMAQYRRVQLPGPPPEYAVTSNGGVLLYRGEPDASWQSRIARRTAADCAPLPVVHGFLSDPAFGAWILNLRIAEDRFVYAIVDRETLPAEFVPALEQRCRTVGWRVSLQGRKLYCVPEPVSKQAAVAEVRRRTGAALVIAAGDSLLDQQMLDDADLAIRPAHGELAELDYRGANLHVTALGGVLAGAEILQWIAEQVSESGSALKSSVLGG